MIRLHVHVQHTFHHVIAGIHNYDAKHLQKAVQLLERVHDKYPFESLVSEPFPLSDVDAAFQAAMSRKFHRVAMTYDQ